MDTQTNIVIVDAVNQLPRGCIMRQVDGEKPETVAELYPGTTVYTLAHDYVKPPRCWVVVE